MSALALASLALTGHPGAAGPPLVANHALHLVTMAGWIGGLPPFTAALALYAADPARRDALGAMMRYSRAGHVAAPLVLLTGALDAVAITGAPPWRALTFYRGAMLVKVALFAAMAALALVNRYVLAPRVRGSRGAARALAAGAAAEVALGLAALAAGALLSETDPS